MVKGEHALTRIERELCASLGDGTDGSIAVRGGIRKRLRLCGEESVGGDFIGHLTIVDKKFCAGRDSGKEGGYGYMGGRWCGESFMVNGDLMRGIEEYCRCLHRSV